MKHNIISYLSSAFVAVTVAISSAQAESLPEPQEMSFTELQSFHNKYKPYIVPEAEYRVTKDNYLTSAGFVFCVGLAIRQNGTLFFAHINPTQNNAQQLSEDILKYIDPNQDVDVTLFNVKNKNSIEEDKRYFFGDPKYLNWRAYQMVEQSLSTAKITGNKAFYELSKGEMEIVIVPTDPKKPPQSRWYDVITPVTNVLLSIKSNVENPYIP